MDMRASISSAQMQHSMAITACTRCHNLMACATSRVHAYLRGGHHQAHALLGVALFLYDGGGAVHESINGGGGLRLRLLPPADAHHALITCCSSKRESLKRACRAAFGSQDSLGLHGCTPGMCCSEQCGMSAAGKKQWGGVPWAEILPSSCVANMQHRRSCQDKWAAGKQLDRVKRRVLKAALREHSRGVQGVQGRQATHCREAHAL